MLNYLGLELIIIFSRSHLWQWEMRSLSPRPPTNHTVSPDRRPLSQTLSQLLSVGFHFFSHFALFPHARPLTALHRFAETSHRFAIINPYVLQRNGPALYFLLLCY